ncbi:DUF397 domain-containing protein [Uniformispora flossi]|uniref:DUF397 domain-containing protein n=1 Tax=Uniformispora flossi TaxID=3390723 RepID=UPI003C2BC748
MTDLRWRTSTRSAKWDEQCVEVAPVMPAWRTSTYSQNWDAQCVEVAPAAPAVWVRDTKRRAGPGVSFTAAAWSGFVVGARLRPLAMSVE